MALQKTVTTDHGLNAKNAYHRVESVQIVGKTKIAYFCRSYASPENIPFAESWYESAYDIDGTNPIAQAYEYLKTLSEFADAEDV